MLKQIYNGQILTPAGWLEHGSVLVEGNKIVQVLNTDLPLANAELIDAKGAYIVPGGIELHVHGGGGRDFMECTEEAFRTAVDTHIQYGTTAIYPTLSTYTVEGYEKAIATAQKLMAEPDSPIMGLHFEGPYFSKKMAGAQRPEWITDPIPEDYNRLLKSGVVKRWDIAPELPGAKEFIQACCAHGCKPCIGHTAATPEDVDMAYENGANHATHFTNAMSTLHKNREFKVAGVVEAVYAIPDFTVEVIADGIHVPPVVMRQVFNSKGVAHMCFCTDCLAVAGSNATKTFNENEIIEDGVCKLADRSALAGSIATMDRLVRTAVQQAGFPMDVACRMISETPAKIMGIYDRKGSLEPGKDADIVLFDEKQEVKFVMQMGRIARNDL